MAVVNFLRRAGISGAFFPALFIVGAVNAQPVPDRPDAGTILQGVPPIREQPRPAGEPPLPAAPKPAMSVASNVKVTLKAVRFTGNVIFGEAVLRDAVRDFLNKEQNAEGLEELLRTVASVYRGAGYFLAQAYFPRQDLTDGNLQIHVLEGVIGKVSVQSEPDARLRQSVAERYLSTIQPGQVASESAIERPLLLLQDLPSAKVTSTLGPGAKPGEADLKVQIGDSGRRLSGIAEVSNWGNKYAGTIQAGGQVFLSNPTGFGDLLSVRALVSQDNLTSVYGVSYALPVGSYGTKFGLNYSQLNYRLGGSFSPLGANGELTFATALVIHPFVRSRNFNLFGQLSVGQKQVTDRLDTLFTEEKRKVDDVRIGVFGDSRDFLLGGGLNSYSATITSGQLRINTPAALAADQTPLFGQGTNGSFSKLNLEGRRVQKLSDNVVVALGVNYQTTNKNLASIEKLSAGGPQAVRAFAVGEGLSDEALIYHVEVRYKVPKLSLFGANLQVVGFFDGAEVNRFHQQPTSDVGATGSLNPNKRSLHGAGFGFRIGSDNKFALVADFAWKMGNEPSQSDVNRNPRGWLHGILYF